MALDVAARGHPGLQPEDLRISATARDLDHLDRVLRALRRHLTQPAHRLLDLGCGAGGVTRQVADGLDIDDVLGADTDGCRLAAAAAQGVRPLLVDLEHDALPLADGSVGLVTSFGLLPYLGLYDHLLGEVVRVLEPGGLFVVSVPNLGSWVNRVCLLTGYQPVDVAVSRYRAGTVRAGASATFAAPRLHAATLRCLRELLKVSGLETLWIRGFSPDVRRLAARPVDRIANRFPSWSRRFTIIARRP